MATRALGALRGAVVAVKWVLRGAVNDDYYFRKGVRVYVPVYHM